MKILLVLSAMLTTLPVRAMAAPIDAAQAQAVFAEAKAISDKDGGRLWGRALYGPILLVAPESRFAAANRAAGQGELTPLNGVFTGRLPEAVNISDSPTDWLGVRWTQLMWPLSPDDAARHVTLAHEMFHRIQPTVGLATADDGDNHHLDTLEGRYWLQLEWRALSAALGAGGEAQRDAATRDALLFRAERYRRFPGAQAQEALLERIEGSAEYTGVRLGLDTPQARIAYARSDLTRHLADPSFVRSFAYATGPAYGLLLDQAAPDWRPRFIAGARFDQLLQAALRTPLPSEPDAAAQVRTARYDPQGQLRAAEAQREAARQARMAQLRARLVDGPVLIAPMLHSNVQFNPSTLQPLDGAGTVYPTLRLTAAWGVLEVSEGGAMLDKDWKVVTVPAGRLRPGSLAGEGWTLTLKPGWTVRPGPRTGDLLVSPQTETPP